MEGNRREVSLSPKCPVIMSQASLVKQISENVPSVPEFPEFLSPSSDVHRPDHPDDHLGPDYHWYRQDSNGLWSSKHGGTKVGPQVSSPDTDAHSWGYNVFCGTMCAPN